MIVVQPAEWLVRRWQDVLDAAAEIGGWFDVYSHGLLKRDDSDEEGLPSECPKAIPVLTKDDEWLDWPHKLTFAEERELEGYTFMEYRFGTYAIFRAPRAVHDRLNEGYEDTAGTENERFVQDGDHVIVVYML